MSRLHRKARYTYILICVMENKTRSGRDSNQKPVAGKKRCLEEKNLAPDYKSLALAIENSVIEVKKTENIGFVNILKKKTTFLGSINFEKKTHDVDALSISRILKD